MDQDRFDRLARVLGSQVPRRRVLRGLIGGSAAGVLAAVGIGRAGAKTDKVGICHRTGNGSFHHITVAASAVPAHEAHGDVVTDLDDVENCGACGNVCGGGDECNAPVCVDGSCSTAPANEGGACTAEDGEDGTCTAGTCVPNPPVCTPAPLCATDADCGAGQVCQNGGCFTACASDAECSQECANCFCDRSIDGEARACRDYDFGIGACASDADCPPGSVCDPFIVNPVGENLCTRPCPTLQ